MRSFNFNILKSIKLPFGLSVAQIESTLKLLVAFLLIVLTLRIVSSILLKLVRLIHSLRQPQAFLELTPPKVTEVSALSTTELFSLISGIMQQRSLLDRLLLRQSSYSFEIVSTKEEGIKYVICVPGSVASLLEKTLRAYLPGLTLKETSEYLPIELKKSTKVTEFKLISHFAFPLSAHASLHEHDPLSYLTGNMTQLGEGELMAVQIIVRPINSIYQMRVRREISKIKMLIRYNRFSDWSRNLGFHKAINISIGLLDVLVNVLTGTLTFVADLLTNAPPLPKTTKDAPKPLTIIEQELQGLVSAKLDQPLFEATIRSLVLASKDQVVMRERGLRSSFAGFRHPCGQALIPSRSIAKKMRLWQFRRRLSDKSLYLTSSEIGSLYHFPHTAKSETEDLIRIKSRELPAPLTLKNSSGLDVVFGKNLYGNTETLVGLSDEDRSRHVYLIGQTGSGKTTVMYHMASDDSKKGRGLAVIDPHGDLAEDLLSCFPQERTDDLIYFNPFDIKFPVGINLLELTQSLDEDEAELEKELVCESVISIFRRVFSKDENTDAHRIEYILRNTIYTAFTVPSCTIFTVYDLLNTPTFRSLVVRKLKDENLRQFWKNEFGKAGDFQVVKMVGGVTAKVGRFLFSPTAKRILEQPKSTINFDEVLEQKKVLICNLAEGKIGEDTSQLLGTTIIAKIQQATVRRARSEKSTRAPFYLFVDEFQNFATSSFTKLLSGGRKFGLRITIAEQSTAQQADVHITNVILANTGTVICFRTASPVDEELMLAQFAPHVLPGDIGNLPRYRFYMRLSAVEPSAPFSGETLPMALSRDQDHIDMLIEASRGNYAIRYQKSEKKEVSFTKTPLKKVSDELVPSIDALA